MPHNILKEIYDLTESKKAIEKRLQELWEIVDKDNIERIGNYEVVRKEIQLRNIDPEKFRIAFGQEIFNKVASVSLKDALSEVPEPKLMESDCITYSTRVSKSVVFLKKTSTGIAV